MNNIHYMNFENESENKLAKKMLISYKISKMNLFIMRNELNFSYLSENIHE